jgi:hypothetical protein
MQECGAGSLQPCYPMLPHLTPLAQIPASEHGRAVDVGRVEAGRSALLLWQHTRAAPGGRRCIS